MPICTFTTNIPSEDIPEKFPVELAHEVARVLSKPIELVTLAMYPDTTMIRHGTTAPAALFSIWSINVFAIDKNPVYAKSLTDFVISKLNLTGDRVGIVFHELQPTQLGWPVP